LGLIQTSWRTFIRKTKRKLSILQAEKRLLGGKRLVLYTLLKKLKEKRKDNDNDIITKTTITDERQILNSQNMTTTTAAVSY